jgi:hypothetical protein
VVNISRNALKFANSNFPPTNANHPTKLFFTLFIKSNVFSELQLLN